MSGGYDVYSCMDMENAFRIRALYTVFDEWIEDGYFFAGERHNFWELVIAAEGEVGITAGENAWVVKQGQAVLHPPMEFHRIWYAGTPGRIIVFSFGAEGLSQEAGGSFAVAELAHPEQLLQQMRQCFRIDGITIVGLLQQEISAQMLLKCWELFLLELINSQKQLRHEARSRTAKNYAAIVKVLENHVYENLSTAQIAQLCSMSQISVKQTFSRYAGMGIMNYFNRLKIEVAINMLQSGSSVQETAAVLGFSTQNYFSTVFKRITGRTPTSYKP